MKRISASEQTREHLRALIEGRLGTPRGRSSLVLLAARLILEEALEGEVRDEIGRERYERADGEAKGYRNGYRPGQMKTAEGMVEFSAPQVRDTPEPFVSAIRENLAGRTQALEDLAVELYARGLSTRDIEDAFRDQSGRRLLSRAAVSEITERLWAEYEAFSKRDLSEYRIVYLYVDGIAERLRAGQAVMAAWGISEDGRKVLLHLTSWAARRRTPRRCGHSSRTCARAGSASPCWSSATERLASSAPSRSASRVRRVSAAWRTGCAIWR